MSLASILLLGFLLGMRHATDADHVVAVGAMVSQKRSLLGAAPVGLAWGVGHTLTILLVGGLIVVFGVVITPRMGLGMELGVAVMLVLLGALTLRASVRESRRRSAAAAYRVPSADRHDHVGGGALERLDQRWRSSSSYGLVRPLLIGIVHGLAGSAAIALLVLGTVHEAPAAVAYLLCFGVGTIAGMLLITLVLAAPVILTKDRFAGLHRMLGVGSGCLSVALGLYVGYEITVMHGLFGIDPQWTPR